MTPSINPNVERQSRHALIIGSGIGGLATAIALKQSGFAVTVFERVAELREVGAGLSLWANAIRALDQLGLGAEIRRHALPEAAGGIRTPNGDLLMATTNAQLQARFGELSVMIHRAELHDLLHNALQQEVQLGMGCIRVEEHEHGVQAYFRNGQTVQGDLLIGADGLHSQIRSQLHGTQPPTYAGYTAWRAVVSFDPKLLQVGETWGAGARFGQIPMKDGRVYWFATQNCPVGLASAQGEKQALLDLFGHWHAPIPALIEATYPAAILRNDIYDRPPLKRWGRGRITLLGDAAHPMTPNLGQGACQALEDAVILAKQLRIQPDIPAALRAYETIRIPRTTWIVQQSRRVGWVGQWQHPLAITLRNFLVKQLLSHFQYQQFAPLIGYEW